MLARLRIAQRLSLLLILPLAAVVMVSLPFAVDRVDAARAAGAIMNSVNRAEAVGRVVQELQRERLLALAYQASDLVERTALVVQIEATSEAINVAGTAGAADPLKTVREQVLGRRGDPVTTISRYDDVIEALIDGLRLGDQAASDATGLRQMTSMDAMLRMNEHAAQIGAALVVATVDPEQARSIVSVAAPMQELNLERFRQTADPADVALFGQADSGPTAERTAALVARLSGVSSLSIEESFAVASNAIAIHWSLQSRVAQDIRDRARGRATDAAAVATTVAALAATLIAVVTWLGVAVSRSVARPLRRVTVAATAVADLASREMARLADMESRDESPPRLAAVMLRTDDEIGELASAFNRVQATAALLMEQQVTMRRNVAVMFGNIANRTHSLVSRQLATIDGLERDEHDDERLARLYRLDHLSTRLRRSADSLLVIAGADQAAQIPQPTPLVDVIRSAIAEVEGYQSIGLGGISDVVVSAAVVSDLTLLLAELLENATAFSPPQVRVEVTASLRNDCVVRIVDHGMGMTEQRLAEENRRLLTRERLDIAPTTMLGLIVVGRLARRHGMTVRLLATPVSGVTAEVVLPVRLLMSPARPFGSGSIASSAVATLDPPAPREVAGGRHALHDAAATAPAAPLPPGTDPRFGWFSGAECGDSAAINDARPADAVPSRGGLNRRQPGQSLAGLESPDIAERGSDTVRAAPPAARRPRDPQAERDALDAFAAGTARGVASADRWTGPVQAPLGRPPVVPQNAAPGVALPPTPMPSRGGLQRRQPGANLDASLRAEMRRGAAAPSARAQAADKSRSAGPMRDAEAERAQLMGYLDALNRAAHIAQPPYDPRSMP